jgi:hypothetical protein
MKYVFTKRQRSEIWVLVSYLESFDGAPQYIVKDQKGSLHGEGPLYTPSPREAKQWGTRQGAHQFLKRLGCYNTFPQNLSAYGFAG